MADFRENGMEDVMLMMEGDLTIERAAELREVLLAALKNSDSVIIRFEGDPAADISFIQLIYAAYGSALASGKQLKLADFPHNLMEVIRSGGYAHHPVWDSDSNASSVKSEGGKNG